ncbi:uncharacterized protein LOC117109646 [Anneissia japonica]|uniref:uncharacterized protein LOC117109646 n=1 Tax=Anneissia japonica TaxID=1529436 RepID=UPI00142572CC|nr:uncharacterized protein LOC117109646 [Anneissia japonica]
MGLARLDMHLKRKHQFAVHSDEYKKYNQVEKLKKNDDVLMSKFAKYLEDTLNMPKKHVNQVRSEITHIWKIYGQDVGSGSLNNILDPEILKNLFTECYCTMQEAVFHSINGLVSKPRKCYHSSAARASAGNVGGLSSNPDGANSEITIIF